MSELPVGPKSRQMLAAVGVTTLDELDRRGAVEVYCAVVATGVFRPSLNLLWGLEAVLLGVHWADLPADHKARLRAQVEARSAGG